VEARLLLQGYIRRVTSVPTERRDLNDRSLWEGLARISTKKYERGWVWVIREVAAGHVVQKVLDIAGAWWCEYFIFKLLAAINLTLHIQLQESSDLPRRQMVSRPCGSLKGGP
jgi:hypothetical protein